MRKIDPGASSEQGFELLMKLTIDKALPFPVDGVVEVYQVSESQLLQKIEVDGEHFEETINLDGRRVEYLLWLVERDGLEALVANAYINDAVESAGAFGGSARLEAYQTPTATRALNYLTLELQHDVLHELHDQLVANGSQAYPLNPRENESNNS